MVCLPIEILNEKYKRKALEFNFGMFVEEKHYTVENKRVFEQLLRKMASIKLTDLELESEFMFKSEKKNFLRHIIKEMYCQFNKTGECFVKIDSYNFIAFKMPK